MTTESTGSVTRWIDVLKGDPPHRGLSHGLDLATRALWGRYNGPLLRLARSRLKPANGAAPPPGIDEEDVALSAFHTFCRMAAEGRFPKLDDRDDLWRLLVTITARKASNERKSANRQKRGGGRVLDEAALDGQSASQSQALAQFVGDEPTPEFVAMVNEEFRHLLTKLRKPEFVTIALKKFEGYSNAEIAVELGCVERTVERKLEIIRRTWLSEPDDDSATETRVPSRPDPEHN
ncbi:MAG: ECF-type sigma factor [Isosphaeraceae bacterium]